MYIFTAHFCILKGSDLRYSFVKDDETIITGNMYEADGYTCATASAVILLLSNETLAIRCRTGACGDDLIEDSNDRNAFSGALINMIH